MLAAPPQPVVLATSVASYLVAPAAGRRVTAWLEFPASHAGSPDAVGAAQGQPPRDRRSRRPARAGRLRRRLRGLQRCDTVAAPQAGADTVLYAVADGRHADLASVTLQIRPGRLVAQMRQPWAGRRRHARWSAAVWYTAGRVRERPPDLEPAPRSWRRRVDVRAVVRHEPVTAGWRAAAGRTRPSSWTGRPAALPRDAAGRAADLWRHSTAAASRRGPHGGRSAGGRRCARSCAASR